MRTLRLLSRQFHASLYLFERFVVTPTYFHHLWTGLVEMPKRSILRTFHKFLWDSDSTEHIVEYLQKITLINLSSETREAITCKIFGNSLGDPALTWFLNLPNKSINSFSQLVDDFVVKCSSHRRFRLTIYHLFSVAKKESESLREYLSRY